MKKLLCLIFSVCLTITLTSCDSNDIPNGVENQSFYKDMIQILKNVEKGLQKNSLNLYKRKNDEILYEYVKQKESKQLTDKELEIYDKVENVNVSFNLYLKWYFDSDYKYNEQKLIDDTMMFGDDLLKDIQIAINIMELEYDFSNER